MTPDIVEVKRLFELLNCLLPSTTNHDSDVSACLYKGTTEYLSRIGCTELASHVNGLEVHEAFYLCCQHFLSLCLKIEHEDTNTPLFSIHQEHQLNKCMEFIICFGIYPLLDSGVSVPLVMRLESYSYFNCPKNLADPKRHVKLMNIVKCLTYLKYAKSVQLNRLLSPNMYLSDLLAALFQLSYGIKFLDNSGDSLAEENQSFKSIVMESRQILWKLLIELPRHVAMRELLVLQGGNHNTPKIKGAVQLPCAPIWLRKSCGRLLSRLLVCNLPLTSDCGAKVSTGIKSLIVAAVSLSPGVLSTSSGIITSIDPRRQSDLASGLSHILTSVPAFLINPSSNKSSMEFTDKYNYFSFITTEILELMRLDKRIVPCLSPDVDVASTVIDRFAFSIGISVVHELCKKFPKLGLHLLMEPLLRTLYQCVATDTLTVNSADSQTPSTVPDTSDEFLLATSDELTYAIKYYMDLLDFSNPTLIVLLELAKLSKLLFLLLTQIWADKVKSGTFDTNTLIMKDTLIKVLCRVLRVAVDCPSDRLSLLRSWFDLPSPNYPSLDLSKPNHNGSSNQYLTCYACRDRIKFRLTTLIQSVDSSPNNSIPLEEQLIPIHCRIPYCCVTTKENVYQNLAVNLPFLTCMIEALMELFKYLYSLDHPSNSKVNSDEDAENLAPHLQKLFKEFDSNEEQTQLDQEYTLISDFFLSLISDVNEQILSMLNQPRDSICIRSDNTNEAEVQTTRGLVSSVLVSAMLDTLGDFVWPTEVKKVIDLFELTLNRLCLIGNQNFGHTMPDFIYEMLSQLLGILAFYINQLGPPKRDSHTLLNRDHLSRLLPIFDHLEKWLKAQRTNEFSSILELLHCLRISLCTRGAIPLSTNNTEPPQHSLLTSQIGKNIEHLSDSPALIEEIHSDVDTVTNGSTEPVEPMDPSLQKIVDELRDPLIPVQGHALIMLSRLLESRDPRIKGHEEYIFQLLSNYLTHPDSYVYLNVIRGLSAMGELFTDRILQKLLEQFSRCSQSSLKQAHLPNAQPTKYSVEYQLKLGESIMRSLRHLGELAPKYRSAVLNAFTSGARDREPLVRAASLSNLAEFVCLLKHAFLPISYEVFALIETHLSEDDSPLVRKAAAYLARSLFKSDQSTAGLPEWLPDDILRDIYKLLSSRRRIERDHTVSEQIEAALGELDRCARRAVFLRPDSPSKLIKQIRILNP